MTDIQALRVHEHGARARCENVTLPPLESGQVRIRNHYSSLNYKDALAVTGTGKIMRRFPCTAGIDVAGVIEDSADERFAVGDRVLVTGCNIGEKQDGGLAEASQLPGDFLIRVPDAVPLRDAMTLGTAGFTAGLALQRMLDNDQHPHMGPIAVSGATGGVGSVAIALLAARGFQITAVTSKLNQAEYLKGLGASELLDSGSISAPEAPLLKGQWGGAVDNVGGTVLGWLLATTNSWGNVASIGLAASHELHTTVMPFILRGVNLLGIHSVDTPMPRRRQVWDHLFGDWRLADLQRIVADEVGLDGVPAACDRLIQGGVTGRFLVRLPAADD